MICEELHLAVTSHSLVGYLAGISDAAIKTVDSHKYILLTPIGPGEPAQVQYDHETLSGKSL